MKHFEYNSPEWFDQARELSVDDLSYHLGIVRQALRMKLSALLMDTSEDDPLICDIVIDSNSQGLSDALKPHIHAAYQQPTEGGIYFVIDNTIADFDDIDIESAVEIYLKLSNHG